MLATIPVYINASLVSLLQENYRKASIICPEDEIKGLGGCGGSTPEDISAQLSRLNRRLQHESQR